MEIKTKIITSIGAVIFVGSVVISPLEIPCVFDAAVLEIGGAQECYEKEGDYQAIKDLRFQKYEDNMGKALSGTIGYFETYKDLNKFLATINEEIKRGNLDEHVKLLNAGTFRQKILSFKNK